MDPSPAALLPPKRLLQFEIVTVVLMAFATATASALYLFARHVLSSRRTTLITTGIPGHTGIDVLLQCVLLIAGSAVVLLVAYVLARSGESLGSTGLRGDALPADVGQAILLTIAMIMLAGFVIGVLHGIGLQPWSEPTGRGADAAFLPVGWLTALRAGVVEEVVVCGYLLHRLRQLGWDDNRALMTSVAVRASYHVYGGGVLVVFTILFGLIVGRLYQHNRRLTPLVLMHFFYDAALFTLALTR
jgi:membrane protease YdiL (CAAX protease family)